MKWKKERFDRMLPPARKDDPIDWRPRMADYVVDGEHVSWEDVLDIPRRPAHSDLITAMRMALIAAGETPKEPPGKAFVFGTGGDMDDSMRMHFFSSQGVEIRDPIRGMMWGMDPFEPFNTKTYTVKEYIELCKQKN